VILVSLLAFLLYPFACNAQIDQETMLLQARQHLEKAEYYYATTWLERLLKSYPTTSHRKEVLLLISKAYAASDREEKASKALSTLLKEYPESSQSLDPQLLKLANVGAPAGPSLSGRPGPAHKGPGSSQTIPPATTPQTAPPAARSLVALAKTQAPPAGPEAPAPVTKGPASAKTDPQAKVLSGNQVLAEPALKKEPAVSSAPPVSPPKELSKEVKKGAATATAALAETLPSPPARSQATSGADDKIEKGVAAKGYLLKVGEFVLKSAMAEAKKKIAEAGLSPVVIQGPKTEAAMIRLQVEAPTDQQSARRALDRLKKANGQGIILLKEGRYRVYAGSYYDERIAEKEQERLATFGIKASMHAIMVPVPTLLLTAGTFTTREAAHEQELKLQKRGLETVIIENGN